MKTVECIVDLGQTSLVTTMDRITFTELQNAIKTNTFKIWIVGDAKYSTDEITSVIEITPKETDNERIVEQFNKILSWYEDQLVAGNNIHDDIDLMDVQDLRDVIDCVVREH